MRVIITQSRAYSLQAAKKFVAKKEEVGGIAWFERDISSPYGDYIFGGYRLSWIPLSRIRNHVRREDAGSEHDLSARLTKVRAALAAVCEAGSLAEARALAMALTEAPAIDRSAAAGGGRGARVIRKERDLWDLPAAKKFVEEKQGKGGLAWYGTEYSAMHGNFGLQGYRPYSVSLRALRNHVRRWDAGTERDLVAHLAEARAALSQVLESSTLRQAKRIAKKAGEQRKITLGST